VVVGSVVVGSVVVGSVVVGSVVVGSVVVGSVVVGSVVVGSVVLGLLVLAGTPRSGATAGHVAPERRPVSRGFSQIRTCEVSSRMWSRSKSVAVPAGSGPDQWRPDR
jgi:hypothetical protein